MPKLRKEDVADIDVRALDEAEYSETEYERYEGEIPPTNTELTGFVRAMWWCRTAEKDDGSGMDPMIKVMWVAGDNEGELKKYDGLSIIENLVLIPSVKFRWQPFFNVFGITMKAVKTATFVEDDFDERWGGNPIEKIGDFVPGENEDGAWSRVITSRRYWNEEWRAEAKKWLPYEDDESALPAEEEEDEAEELDDELEDEEEYEDEEPEEEPEPEPVRATRGRKPKAAAATTAKPAPRGRAAKPVAAATARGRGRPAAASKPVTRGRGRGKAATDNNPPF